MVWTHTHTCTQHCPYMPLALSHTDKRTHNHSYQNRQTQKRHTQNRNTQNRDTQHRNGHTQTDHSFIIHMSCLCVRQGFYSRRAAFHTLSVLLKESDVCLCVSLSLCARVVIAAILKVKWLQEEHLLALKGPLQ